MDLVQQDEQIDLTQSLNSLTSLQFENILNTRHRNLSSSRYSTLDETAIEQPNRLQFSAGGTCEADKGELHPNLFLHRQTPREVTEFHYNSPTPYQSPNNSINDRETSRSTGSNSDNFHSPKESMSQRKNNQLRGSIHESSNFNNTFNPLSVSNNSVHSFYNENSTCELVSHDHSSWFHSTPSEEEPNDRIKFINCLERL